MLSNLTREAQNTQWNNSLYNVAGIFAQWFEREEWNQHIGLYKKVVLYTYKFWACKFQGCHKSSIFAILFLRIAKYPALRLMEAKVFANEISRIKILCIASWPRRPQKLHPLKVCTYTVGFSWNSIMYNGKLTQQKTFANPLC